MGSRRVAVRTAFRALAVAVLLTSAPCAAEDSTAKEVESCNYAAGLGAEFEKLCAGLNNSFQCASVIEKHQLARPIRGVERDGATLVLRARSGAVVRLTDHADPLEPEAAFRYLDSRPELHAHLIHVQYWEGVAYLLVDAESGVRQTIRELPLLSPDGMRFATVSAAEAYATNGIQIWRLDRAGPKLEWTLDADEWWPDAATWDGPTRFRFVKRSWSEESGPANTAITAVREQGKWRLAP